MGHWDAIVIGGGPAGLAAAIALRQRGLDVLVAEALTPPIDKACGEGLMPDSRRELALLGVELDADDGVEFSGIHFALRDSLPGNGRRENTVTAAFGTGRGLGLRRVCLHERLIERATALGVALHWGCRVELREKQPLRIDGAEAKYRYLIAADGQSSRVRSWARLGNGKLISRRFGYRRHYRVEPWSDNVEVHWGVCGQAYVTPVGRDEVCVATLSRSSRLSHDQLLGRLPFLQAKLAGAPVCTTPRGSITTTRKMDRVTTENIAGNVAQSVALIGDASGSADAITGEGLATGFRQALLLAESIAGGGPEQGLEQYEASHGAILKMPQTMARVMLAMDRWAWFRGRAMRMLAADPPLFAEMLAVHVGEESMQSFLLRRGGKVAWQMLAPSVPLTADREYEDAPV